MLDFQASRWLVGRRGPAAGGQQSSDWHSDRSLRDKDGHINIAASGDDIYKRLCSAIERPDLLDRCALLDVAGALDEPRHVMNDVLKPVTRQKSSADWIKLLNEAGVPCGPIYTIDQTFADPQVQHLAMAQPVHSPILGDITIVGHPVSHGAKRNPVRTPAPELGQDNEDVLTSLGYSKDQIADLAHRGVI